MLKLPKQQEDIESQKRTNEFTIFQDLSNVTGVAAEVDIVMKTLPKTNQIVIIQLNRLIVQINLSNSINVDTYNGATLPEVKEHLNIIKQQAKDKFLKYKNYIQTHEVQEIIKLYLEFNLQDPPKQNQKQLLPMLKSTQFRQNTFNIMAECLNKTDEIYDKLRQGTYQYKAPSDLEIILTNKARQEITKQKLTELAK